MVVAPTGFEPVLWPRSRFRLLPHACVAGLDGLDDTTETPSQILALASAPWPLEIDDGTVETVWILPRDVLDAIGDRDEIIGPKRRRDEDDPGVFEIRRDELPGQLGKISDVARDDGPAITGGITKLAGVVEAPVTDLMSTDHVQPAGAQDLGDPLREVLVEVERHPAATIRTSPG